MSKKKSSVEAWKAYLAKLGTPRDDFERTRFHYLCFEHDRARSNRIVLSVISLFLMLPTLLFLWLKGKNRKQGGETYDAVLFSSRASLSGVLEDIPEELRGEFPRRVESKRSNKVLERFVGGYLDAPALRLWWKMVCRYPLAVYMNYYLLLHLALTCQLLHDYHARAIISIQTEQDFSTTLMTHYCEKMNAEYIGFMHGEYMLAIDRAYVRFSRYYAWDWESVKLFTTTGSPSDIFRVYQTSRLLPKYKKRETTTSFLSYYLGSENAVQLNQLKERLQPFADKQLKCKVRPHPRWTDRKALSEAFDGTPFEIEEPSQVSLKDSVEGAEYVVSVCSTVLSEAHASGLNAVIDDMSEYVTLAELESRMYTNLQKIPMRLSGLLDQYGKKA